MRVIRVRIPVYRLAGYVKRVWGVPFIVIFQGMLLVCASLVVLKNTVLANDLAVYAYYFLVVGIILEVVRFAADREKSTDERPTVTDTKC